MTTESPLPLPTRSAPRTWMDPDAEVLIRTLEVEAIDRRHLVLRHRRVERVSLKRPDLAGSEGRRSVDPRIDDVSRSVVQVHFHEGIITTAERADDRYTPASRGRRVRRCARV